MTPTTTLQHVREDLGRADGDGHVAVTVIGAGPAGLAASRALTARSVDHVVVERGRVGESWRSRRWDSLRVLSPNWLSPPLDLDPGRADEFASAADVVVALERRARSGSVAVLEGTEVRSVRHDGSRHVIDTTSGRWTSDGVIVATGACAAPAIPSAADALPGDVDQLHALHYRRPAQLSDEGRAVLVVGASASGVQIADELARSGRSVMIAVGDHTRLPRRYRGRDIHWWLDAMGILGEHLGAVPDPDRARRLPSLQLVGSDDHRTLGLAELQAVGVELVGRFVGVSAPAGGAVQAQFSGSLANFVAAADLKMERLLARIDEFVEEAGWEKDLEPAERPPRTTVSSPRTTVPFDDIGHVVWATGARPDHSFLDAAWLDRRGVVRHELGVGLVRGLVVLGLPFLRRRDSSFLAGIDRDAAELVDHLLESLSVCGR